MKKNYIKKLIIAAFCFSLSISCTSKNSEVANLSLNNKTSEEKVNEEKIFLNNQFFFLNSILTLNILDDNADKDEINSKVQKKVAELEAKFTINSNESEVSKINENAGITAVSVSDETYNLIKNSINYSEISKGKFDVSIGNLVKLWSIGNEDEKIPSEDEIKSSLETVDYKKIILDDKNKSVFLKDKNMMIDLGAIAKGYVADEIVKILEEKGVNSAIINLGGNVYVHGNKNGKDFKVGIRDPFSADPNSHFAIYSTSNESIVTSGVYERFFEKDGIRYHHILSTENGYPIDNELMSTTIFSENSMQADALSTTTFALGLEEGMKLIENTPNTKAIFVTRDKKVYTSSNIKDKLVLSNEEYSLAN